MKKIKIYILNSFNKFGRDAFSKAIYDAVKYLIVLLIGLVISIFIPRLSEFLKFTFPLSIWAISLIILLTIIFSFLLANRIFKRKFEKLQEENHTDPLTGLKNYKALKQDLKKIEEEKNENFTPVSVILIDVDDFKEFNEKYGYDTADQILRKLGQLLLKDSRATDETYRYFMRGDEFLIIAKNTTLSDAELASERKRKLIEKSSFNVDNNHFKLTVCCGVTEFNLDESQDFVRERVNKALLNAKKTEGKNTTKIVV